MVSSPTFSVVTKIYCMVSSFDLFYSLLKPRYFIKLTDFKVNIIKILLVAILKISKLKVKYLFFYPVHFPNFQNVTKLTVGNGFTSFTEISLSLGFLVCSVLNRQPRAYVWRYYRFMKTTTKSNPFFSILC